jgi:hypothetical protein
MERLLRRVDTQPIHAMCDRWLLLFVLPIMEFGKSRNPRIYPMYASTAEKIMHERQRAINFP